VAEWRIAIALAQAQHLRERLHIQASITTAPRTSDKRRIGFPALAVLSEGQVESAVWARTMVKQNDPWTPMGLLALRRRCGSIDLM
jgi:hypothetical protein